MIRLLLTAAVATCHGLLFSQSGIPDKPEIIRVTVDQSDNGILIQWNASTDTDIELYNVYRMINRTGQKIVAVPGNVLQYKHLNTGLKNLEYSITAVDSSSNESLLTPGEHRAVTLSAVFDTCSSDILLSWSEYVGWEGNISGYRLYAGQSPFSMLPIKFLSPATRNYSHVGIDINTTYYYYVETVKTSGVTSLSAIESISTYYPSAPEYIYMDHVSVTGNSTVEIQFTADISGPENNFQVLRSSSPTDTYSLLETIRNPAQSTQQLEDQFSTSDNQYYYKIRSVFEPDGCPDPMLMAESNTGTNILLQSELTNQTAVLNWTPYEHFVNDLSGYIVQRRSSSGEFFDIRSVGSQTTTFTEQITSVINGYQPGEIQYKVLGISNQVGLNEAEISVSNMVSVTVETTIYLPNAITPGSNDMNFEFKPIIDFSPRKYTMIIYDRAGRTLFTTNDASEGWDGRFKTGDFVAEGVYVYYIQYTDYTGLFKTYTGNVTVIFPY